MAAQIVCPRCGARDSFMKGFLPETCVCRVCQSQLDWREIPGCGPDCKAVEPEPPPPPAAPTYVKATGRPAESAAQGDTAEGAEPSEIGGSSESGGSVSPAGEDADPAERELAPKVRGDGGR